MAEQYTGVDLSQLPAPEVVEQLDFEAIFSEMLADLQTRDPVFSALVESDPAYKILEVCAYRELLVRQRANDAAKAVMVAFAEGTDLDQIGANYGVERQVVDPGDPGAIPPIPPTLERDERLRDRIVRSPEGYSVAGPRQAYIFHALSADGRVADVAAESPTPGEVDVVVLEVGVTGAPGASAELVGIVDDALNEETIRPLTDSVTVRAAEVTTYTIDATIYVYPGPEAEVVRQASEDSANAYVNTVRRLGRDVRLSAVYAALHVEGVQRVELTSPAADIPLDYFEVGVCTDVTVTLGGIDE